jgi:hypothetical protein
VVLAEAMVETFLPADPETAAALAAQGARSPAPHATAAP